MSRSRVLLVDDDPIVRDVLARYLMRSGFSVETAGDGAAALIALDGGSPDLVLLDLMLPKLNGFEVLEAIRERTSTPVIMLTAKREEGDRIAGLDFGADDYVTKPFSPREVVARVKAVLRRAEAPPRSLDRLVFGDLAIDGSTKEVTVRGRRVELTPKEFELLQLLASQPRRVFSRLEILGELWDFAFEGDPSTVTVHIRRLREKVEEDPSDPRRLVTVWGSGYRFEP